MQLKDYIHTVADFPQPGIRFRDITPLLNNPQAYMYAINSLAELVKAMQPDALVGIESRGFIFAAPLAHQLGLPLVLVRKPGKLPRDTHTFDYDLEYGQDRVEVHRDDIRDGQRLVIIDDVLATGGTARATASLLEQAGGRVAGLLFLIGLNGLGGAGRLNDYRNEWLVAYDLDE